VTAAGTDYDFVSRFFAPGSGIDEDPVTGSAHCALGPYWARRLGKTQFRAFQASPRGGEVGVRVEGDRVILSGQAVTVMHGDLLG
jgi:predicted PhzF superfamily epimerase YddE/YHI9